MVCQYYSPRGLEIIEEGDKKESRLYSRTELELMTAFQLRDICWRERIINGIQASMDRDELIRQIMRFRGRKEHLFITSFRSFRKP